MVSIFTRRGGWRFAFAALLAAGLGFTPGCGGDDQANSQGEKSPQKSPVENDKSPAGPGTGDEAVAPQPPAVDWDEKLAAASALLEADDLEGANAAIAELKQASDQLSQAQRATLDALTGEADALAASRAEQQREEALKSAQQNLEDGELDTAQADANRVLNLGPSESQRAAAAGLLAKIEATRSARRRLATDIRLLESDNRRDFNTARSSFQREPDVALPLLLEGTQNDNPVFAQNCMRMLRYFKRPDKAVPALIAVLADERRQAIWPTAIEEIARLEDPGAGEPLLELALKSQAGEQRSAALTALSQAVDPPARTLAELLPVLLTADAASPDLAAVLHASRRAATLHGQTDLSARRGFANQLSDEQRQGLADLPRRLEEIAAADTVDGKLGSTGRAARALAVSLRLSPARTLANIKLTRSSGEDSAAPAAAVLDGNWQSIEPANMWRHPRDGRPLIAFDLGGEFTITGVRIWNYNEPSQAGRGWREVDVFAGPDPALLSPVSRGVVPPAPCIAEPHDYSITLSVPFVFGRYVKLEPRSYWNPSETLGGVAEIEILGF